MPVWQMKQKLQARRRKEIKAQSGQQHSHSRVGYTVLSRHRAASVRYAGELTRRALFEYLQRVGSQTVAVIKVRLGVARGPPHAAD